VDHRTLDAETAQAFSPKVPIAYAGRSYPMRPFFGDTHRHRHVDDAGAFGCRLTPRDAYRFAKGQEITASSGQAVSVAALDFLVVSDHSDNMELLPRSVRRQAAHVGGSDRKRWYD
jgi:hypothetical protein